MDDIQSALPAKPVKFLDKYRRCIRQNGLSLRTEKSYIYWAKIFIRFNGKRHPKDMGKAEVSDFLNYLSEQKRVSVNTQRSALNALVFLYRKFLQMDLGKLNFQYAKRGRRTPVVFTHREAMAVIALINQKHRLILELLYGSGLRLNECLRLRIKDLDFGQLQITVRDGKGNKDRVTILPETLVAPLQCQIDKVAKLHQVDLFNGHGEVFMPNALAKKYPNAGTSLGWQFLFPASRTGIDPYCGTERRHHVHDSTIQKHLRRAINRAGILKKAGSHTFRHSFATRLLETGYDLKLIQSLLGHTDIRTTEIYLHVVENRGDVIKSPLDIIVSEIRDQRGSYQARAA